METETISGFFSNLSLIVKAPTTGVLISVLVMFVLLFISALISGSEVAFFSINASGINKLKKDSSTSCKRVLKLLEIPERLLATILISNNFVNIAIVLLSTYITDGLFDFSSHLAIGLIFQIVVVTFLLLLFGEVIPKVYASQSSLTFSKFMSGPLFVLERVLRPLSLILVKSTSVVNKRIKRKKQISITELSHALELTTEDLSEDKEILESIVNFSKKYAHEIMVSRVDVVAVDLQTTFTKLVSVIIESGYSRIPVYSGDFDNIRGVLYVKDLLPHIQKSNTFRWQSLIRPPFYIPDSKKINDLLEDFQKKKIHMAIVVDEYGGTSGIITLEDILEEIIGEIRDEHDEEKSLFTQNEDGSYSFDGKINFSDFLDVIELEENYFDSIERDSDTLAGFILEVKEEIPNKHDIIEFKDVNVTIEAVDDRRIKKIKFQYKS